jgi:glycosyltransferase involved in cell wall biosynthesis
VGKLKAFPGGLSIVVPAYNEAGRLRSTLPRFASFCDRHSDTDVLIVNDGSVDDTGRVVEEFAREHPGVRAIHNAANHGKGYALRQGAMEVAAEWILFTDADLSTPLDEIEKLFDAARRNAASIAIGSRALDRRMVGVHQPLAREWSGRFFNVAMRTITGLPFRDTQCGFKLYRRHAADVVFPRQTLDGFGADVENLVTARVHGLHVVEVPVRWDNVAGTRVGPLSGARAFTDLVAIRANQLRGRYR